jgi:hypothetical protein
MMSADQSAVAPTKSLTKEPLTLRLTQRGAGARGN